MARLIGRVALGEIVPGGAGARHPEDAIQHVARIAPRVAAFVGAPLRLGHGWFEPLALGFGEAHTLPRGKATASRLLRRAIVLSQHAIFMR